MDKVDVLFVRAIKSSSPIFRVKRVYERFYGYKYNPIYVSSILSRIVSHYNLMTTNDWIDAMNPDNQWKYKTDYESLTYHELLIRIFQSAIWSTPYHKFEGFPRSAVWRNRDKATNPEDK